MQPNDSNSFQESMSGYPQSEASRNGWDSPAPNPAAYAQGTYTDPNAATYTQAGIYTDPNGAAYAQGGYTDPSAATYAQGVYTDPSAATYAQAGIYTDPSAAAYAQGVYTDPNGAAYAQGVYTDPNGAAYAQGAYIDPNGAAYAQGAYTDPNGATYTQAGIYTDPNAATYTQAGIYTDPNGAAYAQGVYTDPNTAAYAQQGIYIDPSTGAYMQANGYPLLDALGNPVYPTQQEMQYPGQTPPPTPEVTLQEKKEPAKGKKKSGKRHRHASPLKRILIVALVAVVGFAAYQVFFAPSGTQTATVELRMMSDERTGDALIVRNETVFDEEGVQEIKYVATEGAQIARGDVICQVYSTGYSTKEQTTLQGYRDTIRDYENTLTQAEVNRDTEGVNLDNAVKTAALEVRHMVQGGRGSMIGQETSLQAAITKRQNYYKVKYSSDMKLNRMFEDESRQELSIDSWVKSKVASQDGIVSFYTDGYEAALTPTDYDSYTPANVRGMISGKKPEAAASARGKTSLYRLITKLDQYVVLMLMNDTHWEPRIGSTYKLTLEQFSDTVVDARVLTSTRSGGELLVRLAVIGDVNNVLYMRTCTAKLGEYSECLCVPTGCLYKKNDVDGVVVSRNNGQYFVPVVIERTEKERVFITPVQPGTLNQGDTVLKLK